MGLDLSGFARGLASTDPAGFYLRLQDMQMRKKEAEQRQTLFDQQQQKYNDEQDFNNTLSDSISKIGTPQYRTTEYVSPDQGELAGQTPDQALARQGTGVPTQASVRALDNQIIQQKDPYTYTKADMYRELAPKAAKLGLKETEYITDKQRQAEIMDFKNKYNAAMKSGDPQALAEFFNDSIANPYNTHKDYADGKFMAITPAQQQNMQQVTNPDGSTSFKSPKSAFPAMNVSFFDTKTGQSSTHTLDSEDEMNLAFHRALAEKFPETRGDYDTLRDKIRNTKMAERKINADEIRANAQDRRASAQEDFYIGSIRNGERRNDILEAQARKGSDAATYKASLGYLGMDMKERDEARKVFSGSWSVPTGDPSNPYVENPRGRTLFDRVAGEYGAKKAGDLMSVLPDEAEKIARTFPDAVDKNGYVKPEALMRGMDTAIQVVYKRLAAQQSSASGGQRPAPDKAPPQAGVKAPAPQTDTPRPQQPAPQRGVRMRNGELVVESGVPRKPEPTLGISPSELQQRLSNGKVSPEEMDRLNRYLGR